MDARRRTRSPRGSGEILAEEIIVAASDLLVEQDGDAKVSIRAVAGRVGVTPPSIYLHFADKDALMDAVCARYFEQLDSAMADASVDIADPLERGLQQGLAYVRFALANPVLYRIAFRAPVVGGTSLLVDEVLAMSAYRRFAAVVGELADEGIFDHDDVYDIVLEMWAAAHGVASLMLTKPGLGWDDDLRHAENLMRAICIGRAGLGVLGPRVDHSYARGWLNEQRERVESPNDKMVKRR
ncbi:TetR/AcrR family transcriptional regulator [Gordonia sp. ABSL1-1]|uniref:TetR/AcrR family transcriptional regulator n=1 Tax=Gordonia sp. ABSL1-1 TaxID=3053923 RepID=UPI00257460F3|nr:TetR/AcrR family transcriptional regulator [Gordonia sp. ABSL1-1]MDL9938444.1 TetR/AcrR family transcriptional regulator [Gordonia sp. ABSL1-1]